MTDVPHKRHFRLSGDLPMGDERGGDDGGSHRGARGRSTILKGQWAEPASRSPRLIHSGPNTS